MTIELRELLSQYADQTRPPSIDAPTLIRRGRRLRRRRRLAAGAGVFAVAIAVPVVVLRQARDWVSLPAWSRSEPAEPASPWVDFEGLHLGSSLLPVPSGELQGLRPVGDDAAAYVSSGTVYLVSADGQTSEIGPASEWGLASTDRYVGWWSGADAVVYDAREGKEIARTTPPVGAPGNPNIVDLDEGTMSFITGVGQRAWTWRWAAGDAITEIRAEPGRVVDVAGDRLLVLDGPDLTSEYATGTLRVVEKGRELIRFHDIGDGAHWFDDTGARVLTFRFSAGSNYGVPVVLDVATGRVTELQLDGHVILSGGWDRSGRITVAASVGDTRPELFAPVSPDGSGSQLEVQLAGCDPDTGVCSTFGPIQPTDAAVWISGS